MKRNHPHENMTEETRKQMERLKRELDSEIARAGWYSANVGMTYNHMGAVYYKAKRYKQALKYFRKALSVYLRLPEPPPYLTAVAYANMGSLLDDIGELDSALEAFLAALSHFAQAFSSDEARIGAICHRIAGIYKKKGDRDKMFEWLSYAMQTQFEPVFPEEREVYQTLKKRWGIGDKMKNNP